MNVYEVKERLYYIILHKPIKTLLNTMLYETATQ